MGEIQHLPGKPPMMIVHRELCEQYPIGLPKLIAELSSFVSGKIQEKFLRVPSLQHQGKLVPFRNSDNCYLVRHPFLPIRHSLRI